ncbi:O-antigen ligase family protein [Candidatus Uhrbacteria bacterium]|nr:O-antigen ligase family protein [Candidatus Uhrbacteria bacterium]
MSQFFSRTFWYALACMVALYGIGVVGYYTGTSLILLGIVAALSAVLAFKKLDYTLYLVFIELFSNPHGALLLADVAGFPVSMRMAIFVGVMVGWGIGFLAQRYRPELTDGRAQIFLFIVLAAALGFIIGVLSRDPVSVFKDGNAYLYLLYLLPIFSVTWGHKHRHDFLQMFAAGAIWAAAISFTILYIFTHFWVALLTPVYELVRDLRVAEVTDVGDGVYRVFIQSQMFTAIFGWFVLALTLTGEKRRWLIGLGAVVVAVVLLALSRSFWVGLMPALGFLLFMLYRTTKPKFIGTLRFVGWSFLTAVMGVTFLFVVALFPIPDPSLASGSLVDSLKDRTTETGDAGISSRWKLLTPMLNTIFESPLVGHGFGKAVTFETDDPRIRAINPNGTWSTTSMEWGWFELWIKMGILGPLAFLYAAYELIKRLWAYRSTEQAWIGLALVTGIVFIYGTHFFSPYLNHPIGLGYLLFLIPFLPNKKQAESHGAVFLEEIISVSRPVAVVTSKR